MPIDGLGSISNEQLIAMSLMSNGQLTNDSTSSTETNQYNTLAFQMMMQKYMNEAKNTAESNVNTIIDNSNKQNDDLDVNNAESTSQAMNAVAASNQSSRSAQTYLAGQKLTDIPLVINNSYSYADGSYNTGTSALNNRTPEEQSKIYEAVREASKKYGISEGLILAVIKQESDFDSTCTSGAGAAGLMQIMPSNFSYLGISDPYDVDQNVNGGTKLLREYLDQYNGDIEMALMAYNGGPGTMDRRGVTSSADLYKMPAETQNYVPKVLGYYNNGV